MRTKNLVLFILIIFMLLPAKALAESKNFEVGSLIIPMDSYYQPEAGGGVLEAYGLIYQLLNHRDEQCISACGENQECKADCEHDISVYWIINGNKTEIDGNDLVIEVTADYLVEKGVIAVAKHFRDGTSVIFNGTKGDNGRRISYRGSAFIIHLPELSTAAANYARTLINASDWSAVKVHETLVEFTADYYRRMQGTPPKIALMNNTEGRTSGNAAILESYLRLAGVCTDVYEVVTPNDVAGIAPDGSTMTSRLITDEFDFLWAPHWEGYKRYADDLNGNGQPDVEDVVTQVKLFLESGKALLAECASIETFEYSTNGRFLSDHGLAHNGGTNNAEDISYNDVTSPYAQIGDFPFRPAGGHLHNWRPYQIGDKEAKNFNFDVPPTANASYNNTVTRYTMDTRGWDYYVGGRAFGNNDFGYVIYLGGHKYAACKDDEGLAQPNVHPMKFEFKKKISDEVFKLKIGFTGGTLTIPNIDPSEDFGTLKTGNKLEVDFTGAKVKDKKIEGIRFRNLTDTDQTIESIELAWNNGDADQKIKKIEDKYNDIKHLAAETAQKLVLTITKDFTIAKDPSAVGYASGCAQNSNCKWKNIAGVRYILNTLFNIKYQITNNDDGPLPANDDGPPPENDDGPPPENDDGPPPENDDGPPPENDDGPPPENDDGPPPENDDEISDAIVEFVRSAPIVAHPWLYQGSFEYSSYFGHFRRYNVREATPRMDWDTADGGIPDAGTGNSDLDKRKVYTANYDTTDKTWAKIDFDTANVEALIPKLGINSEEEAIRVINRLRGKDWDNDSGESGDWVERNDPNSHAYRGNFGGIMHAAPAIVSHGDNDARFTRTKEIAYVGDLYGMLHAINTSDGHEEWAYIPRNLLGKLKNDRTTGAEADYAAVDASPTVRDVFFDPEHEQEVNPSWHTILVCPQGAGGKAVFALDVTDPDNWEILWEKTDDNIDYGPNQPQPPGGGVGQAFRAALDKVLVTETDEAGEAAYHTKWMVFVATNYANMEDEYGVDRGGIHVYAFDLKTGDLAWPVPFSSTYADATNQIPAAVTTYDIDGDGFADRIYVGDMNGRMWELNALTGTSPYATEASGGAVPLFSAGIGNPIAVSPAITRRNGHVILVFGTGGTTGATVSAGGRFYIYAVDATRAANFSTQDIDRNFADPDYEAATTHMWRRALEEGEKAWSSPTIAANTVFMAVSGGTLESDDPQSDTGGSGRLVAINLDSNPIWPEPITIGKVRGSLFVSNQHIYLTTINSQTIQVGGRDFAPGFGDRVVLKAWRQF